jgi:hypothetical protein
MLRSFKRQRQSVRVKKYNWFYERVEGLLKTLRGRFKRLFPSYIEGPERKTNQRIKNRSSRKISTFKKYLVPYVRTDIMHGCMHTHTLAHIEFYKIYRMHTNSILDTFTKSVYT